jgi:hypothetical protein
MRFAPLQQHFRSRLRQRVPWLVVGVFTIVFTSLQFMMTPALTEPRPFGVLLNALLMPFLVSFCYPFLSPLPWRWSGDDRPKPSVPRGLLQALTFNAAIILVLVGLSWFMVGDASLKGEVFAAQKGAKPSFATHLVLNLMGGVPLMTIIGAIISFGMITEEEKAAAETKLEEAQWVLLRGQLSPHVLFNSLNGLAELVRQDPLAAEQALLDLSELYRALLKHGDRPRAPLGEERALVQRFLAVEALRLDRRLRVQWDWDEALDEVETPPFLLQPLVENALKHGIAPHPAGGELVIRLHRVGPGLRLQVSNTGKGLGLVPGAGVGLRNLEARLNLAYGPKAVFRLHTVGSATVAEIALETLEVRR